MQRAAITMIAALFFKPVPKSRTEVAMDPSLLTMSEYDYAHCLEGSQKVRNRPFKTPPL